MNFITSLNRIAEGFLTSYAWPVLWQTALLAVIITVASWTFFRKASPQFRYLLWLLVLVRLVLPPAAYLPTGIGNWGRALLDLLPPSARQEQMESRSGEASPVPMFFQFPDVAISEYESPSKDFAPASTSPATVSLSKHALLLLAWAAGIAGLLSFLLIRLIRFHYLLRGAALPDEALSRCVAEYARRLGMRRDVKVRVTDAPYGPILCGFLRPVIVLPRRILLELSHEELAPVLIHELAHVKRGDWLVNWLQVLSGILYFFHPFLWYANRQIRQEREKACDDLVLVAVRLDRKGYVNSLMRVRDRVAGRMGLLPAFVGIVERRSNLSARILRILDPRTRPSAKLSFLSILTLIAFACCFLTFAPKARSSEQENPTESAESRQPSAESQPPSGEGRDAAPTAPAKTISGVVKDVKGQPLENADVLFTADNLEYYGSISMGNLNTLPDGVFTHIGSMKTGADGAFAFTASLPVRADRAYQIIASKPGHAWAGVRINSTKVVEKSNPVQLTLGEPKPLAGRVVNRKGEPVSGALVYPLDILDKRSAYSGRTVLRFTFPGMERFAVKTDAAGRFSFEQLPADWQPGVQVRHPDYAYLSVFPRGTESGFDPGEGIRLELSRPGRIQGRLIDSLTSKPVAGVTLMARISRPYGNLATTGPDGRYEMKNLAPGDYTISDPLCTSGDLGGIVRQRSGVKLGDGQVLSGINLTMKPGIRVRGRVIDERTNRGQPYATVTATQEGTAENPGKWQGDAETDADGQFKITVPEGQFEIRAPRARVVLDAPVAESRSTSQGDKTPALKQGETPGEVAVAPRSNPAFGVSGVVRDAKDQPLENADVLFTGDSLEYYGSISMGNLKSLPNGVFTHIGSMKTGADGAFAFTASLPVRADRAYQIIASKAGHSWAGLRIRSTAEVEKNRPIQLTLGEPKPLAGQVVNRKGEPVSGALVYPLDILDKRSAYSGRTVLRFTFPGMERFAVKTDAAGRFRLDQLPADWQPGVLVRHPDYADLSVLPDEKSPIRAGQQDVRLELAAPSRIQGCVMDTATSRPVEGVALVAVDLFAGNLPLSIAATGADGRYDFPNLAAGVYYSIGPLSDFEFGDKTSASEGIVRSRCPVPLKEGEVLDGMDLPRSPGVTLRGRVVDSKTRKGIPCLTVGVSQDETNLDGPNWHSRIYTDSEGRFEVTAPEGEVKVRALEVGAHVDDLRYTQVLTLKKGKVPEEAVIALPGMVPNRVKGSVSGPDGGPFAGRATIVPGVGNVPGPIQTDDTGHFDFEIRRPFNLPSAPDMPPDLTLYALVPEKNLAGRVPLYSRSEEAMVWIRLRAGGIVIGRVVDEGKKPIPEARITLHPTATASCGYDVIADADGRFRIPSLCDQVEYQLELTSQGYGRTQIRGIKGAAGQTHDCGDIVLTKGSPGASAARGSGQENPPNSAEGQPLSGESRDAPPSVPAKTISGVVRDAQGQPLEEAEAAYGKKDLAQARKIWSQILESDPANAQAKAMLDQTAEEYQAQLADAAKRKEAEEKEKAAQNKLNTPISLSTDVPVPLRELRRSLELLSDLDIYVAQGGEAMINVTFVDKPLHEVLDTILRPIGLKWSRKGDVITIAADRPTGTGPAPGSAQSKPTPRPARLTTFMLQGIVSSITSATITLEDRRTGTAQEPWSLDPETRVFSLKRIQLADIQEPRWAIVSEGPPIPGNPSEASTGRIIVYPERPKKPMKTGVVSSRRDAKGVMRMHLTDAQGTLRVNGNAVELQADEQTFPIQGREFFLAQGGRLLTAGEIVPVRVSESTRIYEATPAALSDVRVGAYVSVEGRMPVTVIHILPADEARRRTPSSAGPERAKSDSETADKEKAAQDKLNTRIRLSTDVPVPLREFRKSLELLSGLDIHVAQGGETMINAAFVGQPLHKVLDTILIHTGLKWSREGDLITITADPIKTKVFQLSEATFVIEPREDLLKSPELSKGFFDRVVEVIEVMLYAKDGKEKARTEGRWMRVDRATGQVTITDYPERLRNISDYLQSLPQLKQKERREYIFLRYLAVNEKTLADIETALGMMPGSIRTPESAGAPGASEEGKGEPVRREDQRAPFSISRFGKQNAIVVTYTDPRDLARVKEVIAQLDRPEVQVEVETLILEVQAKAPVEVRREMEKYLTTDSKVRAAIRSSSSKTSGTLGESAPPAATLHFWESTDPKLREWEKNGYLNVRPGPHMLVINKNSAAFRIEEKKSLRDETAPKTVFSVEFRPKVETDKRIFFQDVRLEGLEAGSGEAYTAEFRPSLLMDENQYVVVGRLRPQADETPSCYVLMKAQLIE